MPEPAKPGDTTGNENGRRRIGEVFFELGFITSEQLDAALVVQRRTGNRLGEILVEQGSLSRLDLASALAEHWEPQPPSRGTRPELSLRPRHATDPIAAQASSLKALEERVEAFGATLEQLESTRVNDAVAAGARFRGIDERLRALDVTLQSVRLEAERTVTSLQAEVSSLSRRVGELEAVRAKEAVLAPPARTPAVGLEGYVAFVPTATGYRLVARSECPPEPGTTVVLEDEVDPLVVVRYGRSPLPFDARPCAYLDFA